MKDMISAKRTSRVFFSLLLLSSWCSSMCWAGTWYAPPQKETVWGAAHYEGQLPELKRMIQENPALIDAGAPDRMTPLMLASEEQALFLLDNGAKADAIDPKGYNALFYADSPKVIERLVKAGCNPNQIAQDGHSPLSSKLAHVGGAGAPNPQAIEALLRLGADPLFVNVKNKGLEHAPLAWATIQYTPYARNPKNPWQIKAVKAMPPIIALLVQYGANPDLKKMFGDGIERSPRSMAKDFPEILALFDQPRAAPAASPQLAAGEIGLAGLLAKMDKDTGQIIISAEKYTLPNGKSGPINPKKEKVIVVTPQTFIHYVNQDKRLAMEDLTAGASLVVVGTDSGSGKPLSAREITVTPAP